MESLNIFGMIAFVFAILLWGRVQRLEQLLRENGIRRRAPEICPAAWPSWPGRRLPCLFTAMVGM